MVIASVTYRSGSGPVPSRGIRVGDDPGSHTFGHLRLRFAEPPAVGDNADSLQTKGAPHEHVRPQTIPPGRGRGHGWSGRVHRPLRPRSPRSGTGEEPGPVPRPV